MNKHFAVVAVLLLSFLLLGCIQREEGLENWTPAGSTIQPNKDLYPSPTPLASAQPSTAPAATPSTAPHATPSPLPSPSPSPAALSCTVSSSPKSGESYLQRQIIVRFTQDVSATVKCYSSSSTQSVDLTLGSAGTYNGFTDCLYPQASTYTVTASGGGATCSSQFTISAP
ncbi:MAG: hypothetical protein WC607_03045 [Candidatus Micrarchaeia archaeon]